MKHLRPALALTVFFILLTGLAFPLLITGLAQAAMPHQANGSMVKHDGKVVGSAIIGQTFASEKFFHGRPAANGYDANNSGGTNLSPTNPKLLEGVEGYDGVKQLAAKYRSLNGLAADTVIPVDAVTRSASGLDPHISLSNAKLQSARVARARGLPTETVSKLIQEATGSRFLGLFGEDTVNVLKLNLSLEKLGPDEK